MKLSECGPHSPRNATRSQHCLPPAASVAAHKKQGRHNCRLSGLKHEDRRVQRLNHYFSSAFDRIVICKQMSCMNRSRSLSRWLRAAVSITETFLGKTTVSQHQPFFVAYNHLLQMYRNYHTMATALSKHSTSKGCS